MIRVLIIDDEPLACELINEYLNAYLDFEVIGFCHNGFDGLKEINAKKPDLIFLDVQMPKINGFEMLELIDNPPSIIFSTAFDQYAMQAFEAQAVDYLLKPFSEERFKQALSKFSKNQASPTSTKEILNALPSVKDANRIVLKDGGKIRILPIQEIIHLEADDDYVKIFTINGKFMKKKTLRYFEDSLSQEHFIRVHRSHLVNLSHINRIDPYEKNGHIALLKDGSRIPVSKSGFQKIKEKLNL